ncbi:MAG: alpha/beta fold hydrolase [Bacteroidia bacterium]
MQTKKLSTPQIIAIIFAIFAALNVFSANNYPFDVKVSGSGKTDLILMPGLSCSGDVWKETAEHYSKTYKCHVLTMHGFAGVKADSTSNFKNWENGIAKYITDNKLQKPIFLGHSIGGGMAMLLASDHPEMFSKIIVVDALPCLGALSNPSYTAQSNPDCSSFVSRFQSMGNDQFYAMQKQTMPSLMADTAHLEEAVNWSVNSDRSTIAQIYCQFLNTDQRESIKNVTCPALVLLEAPFGGMKAGIEEQFKNMKTATLQYSGKALHFIMFDDKEWYFKQIDAFLK